MKLANYAISQHIDTNNWQAAVSIVAAHFNLQMPADYEIVFNERVSRTDIKVVIYYGNMVYCWNSLFGFVASTLASEGRLMTVTYARIYLPASMFGTNKQP
jgi:hypothetical protein